MSSLIVLLSESLLEFHRFSSPSRVWARFSKFVRARAEHMLGFEIFFEPEPSLDSVFKFSPSPSLEPRLGSKMLGSARLGLGLDDL